MGVFDRGSGLCQRASIACQIQWYVSARITGEGCYLYEAMLNAALQAGYPLRSARAMAERAQAAANL